MPGSGKGTDGNLDERREHTRRPCDLEVECRIDNREHKAVAVEVSPRGARVKCNVSFDVGATLLLSHRPQGVPLGRQRIKGKVVWVKPAPSGGFLHGIHLVDDADNLHHSWVYQVLRKLGMDPYKAFKRKARRVDCDLSAVLLNPQGENVGSATVRNLGLGGALVECEAEAPPRMLTLVLVNNAGLQLASRIVNQRADDESCLRISVRFLNHPDSPEMTKLKTILLEIVNSRAM